MSTNLMTVDFSQLGWTKSGRRLKRAPLQDKWLVRRMSGGRPALATTNGTPVLVDYHASSETLREALDFAPGSYRLYPADEDGIEIDDAQVAEFEIKDNAPNADIHEHLFGMFTQFISFVESKDVLLAEVTKSVLESNRSMQAGAVDLLNAASTTINVATGLERPEIDLEAMAKYVAQDLHEREEKVRERQPPWHVQVLNGAFGKSLIANLNSFVAGLAKGHKAK